MPRAHRPTIAVIGAGGFVGRQLMRALENAGLPAVAVVRGAPELSVEGTFHKGVALADIGEIGAYDIVINLAYPATGSPSAYPALNRDIFQTVETLLKEGGRLIHLSTQAVFGLAGDLPIHSGPVESRRDEVYVEAKIDAENHFAHSRKPANALDIVRLGNVWGPASAAWACPI